MPDKTVISSFNNLADVNCLMIDQYSLRGRMLLLSFDFLF